jgi:hypothetical protein
MGDHAMITGGDVKAPDAVGDVQFARTTFTALSPD